MHQIKSNKCLQLHNRFQKFRAKRYGRNALIRYVAANTTLNLIEILAIIDFVETSESKYWWSGTYYVGPPLNGSSGWVPAERRKWVSHEIWKKIYVADSGDDRKIVSI